MQLENRCHQDVFGGRLDPPAQREYATGTTHFNYQMGTPPNNWSLFLDLADQYRNHLLETLQIMSSANRHNLQMGQKTMSYFHT